MRDHLFSKRDWATNSTDGTYTRITVNYVTETPLHITLSSFPSYLLSFFLPHTHCAVHQCLLLVDSLKQSGEADTGVGDGVDLNSDTGRVESVLTESDYDENYEIVKEMNVNVNVSMKEKGKGKGIEKDGEEEEMKILVQALLSDPVSRDSRDRALQTSPPPRALPLYIPPLQIPSFTSSLSSHSSITEPLYGAGQTQYTDVDQALILSALHPREEHYTKNGDDCNSDYVTDICSADTDDNMQVEVRVEGGDELDLDELDVRASLTSVTDQKVRTALGIISDAVEADRNRNILLSVPDALEDNENVLLQESGKGEKELTSKKMPKKTISGNENKIENLESINGKNHNKKEYVDDEVEEYEIEEREQSTRRTFTDEETSILSAAMLNLSREQERREERNTVNFQFLVTTDEAVDKIYEEDEEEEIIEEEQEDKVEEVEEEEEEVVEEEVQRMIDALNLTEFKTKESNARIIKSDVRQVINNGNLDIYNEKEIEFQSSNSCESEYEVYSENGTRSVVPLKARRGVEKRVLDLDFSCQDEGNSVKDKEEAIQDGNLSSNRGLLSSSVSHSYSSDSKGRYEDNADRGQGSRPRTGQLQVQGSRPGTGQVQGQGQGSRPGAGQVQGQGQGSRPETGQVQGQGQGSRPGTGQGRGQGSTLGTGMGVNLDPYERKLSSRSSSSAGLGNINAHDYKPEKFGHTEHQQAADSVTRSTDSENMSGNIRGSISDFDGSYVKAQQPLAMLESSNKDTGRTSTSTRSNTTTPQILTPVCTRVVDGGVRDSEGVSGQITRGTVKGDKPSNTHQAHDDLNSRPATARDSLSNSQYGGEGHHGSGDASRRNQNENEIPLSSSRSTRAEEKERSIEEERIRIAAKEMLKKKERERNILKMDLAECRVLIEDKRNLAMVYFIYVFHLSRCHFTTSFIHLFWISHLQHLVMSLKITMTLFLSTMLCLTLIPLIDLVDLCSCY